MTAWMRRTLEMLSLSKQELEEFVREQAGNNPWLELTFLVNARTNAEALAGAIQAVIAVAGPQARVSDAEVAQRLAEAGLTVARRTVSKHRRNGGLPAPR